MSMIFKTDSYNLGNEEMFPPKMTEASGYIECRENCEFEKISFFGLQYIIKKHLMDTDLKDLDLNYAEKRWNLHGEPFPREGWERIKELGYYPIEIQAVPEGSWIPRGNVLVQMRNTDPLCAWLPTWLETQFDQIWYPIAVNTKDKITKAMLRKYLEDTGCEDITPVLDFMLHDFGYRGCTCHEQAMIGGAAHLVHFKGTDTFPAVDMIRDYYNMDMAGYSIPASNHGVMTAYGKDHEDDALGNILNKFLKPCAIVACVCDSYDMFRMVDVIGTKFREQIMNSGGRLVIRPDSGNPEHIMLTCMNKLVQYFGYTLTKTGHKLLPNCVRMIWGDGINPKRIDEVLYFLTGNGFAAENFVFGMGSAMLQEVRRDMVSLAFKVNEKVDDGVRVPVNKNPVTGRGKASKPGRQALVCCDGYTFTIPEAQIENRKNLLRTVYLNGKLLVNDSFETIRERANEESFEYFGVI